jgi:hypothetical protein
MIMYMVARYLLQKQTSFYPPKSVSTVTSSLASQLCGAVCSCALAFLIVESVKAQLRTNKFTHHIYLMWWTTSSNRGGN